MGRRHFAVFTIALMALNGCGAPAQDPKQMVEAAQAGARFRFVARETYKALRMGSCRRGVRPRLMPRLAMEAARMGVFEDQAGRGASAEQLNLARGDIDYRQAKRTLGCWADSDAQIAAKHTQMARETVTTGLKELSATMGSVPALAVPASLDPWRTAELRALVRDLSSIINPLCPPVGGGAYDGVLAAADREVARLRQSMLATPYAVHFAVAEADAAYERSITQVECSDAPERGDGSEPEHETKALIGRIAALASA